MQKKLSQNYQRYMDKMSEALNKNIDKNIFPYWRNHQSLKGKLTKWVSYFIRLVFDELPFYSNESDYKEALARGSIW